MGMVEKWMGMGWGQFLGVWRWDGDRKNLLGMGQELADFYYHVTL